MKTNHEIPGICTVIKIIAGLSCAAGALLVIGGIMDDVQRPFILLPGFVCLLSVIPLLALEVIVDSVAECACHLRDLRYEGISVAAKKEGAPAELPDRGDKQFVVYIDQAEVGPFPLSTIKRQLGQGFLQRETPCRRTDSATWATVADVVV